MARKARAGHERPEHVDAFSAQIGALTAFYSDDVVCYPAAGWLAGDPVCHGHDGFRKLAAVWGDTITDAALRVHDLRDRGDRVVILAEFTGRSKDGGAPVHQRFGVVNADRCPDGRFGEVRFYLTWQQAREAVRLEE